MSIPKNIIFSIIIYLFHDILCKNSQKINQENNLRKTEEIQLKKTTNYIHINNILLNTVKIEFTSQISLSQIISIKYNLLNDNINTISNSDLSLNSNETILIINNLSLNISNPNIQFIFNISLQKNDNLIYKLISYSIFSADFNIKFPFPFYQNKENLIEISDKNNIYEFKYIKQIIFYNRNNELISFNNFTISNKVLQLRLYLFSYDKYILKSISEDNINSISYNEEYIIQDYYLEEDIFPINSNSDKILIIINLINEQNVQLNKFYCNRKENNLCSNQEIEETKIKITYTINSITPKLINLIDNETQNIYKVYLVTYSFINNVNKLCIIPEEIRNVEFKNTNSYFEINTPENIKRNFSCLIDNKYYLTLTSLSKVITVYFRRININEMESKIYNNLILIDETFNKNITFNEFSFSIIEYNKLNSVYPTNLNVITDSQSLKLIFEKNIKKNYFENISLINLEQGISEKFIFDKENLNENSNVILGTISLLNPYENQYFNISILNECNDKYIENDIYIKNTYLLLIDEIDINYFCFENKYSQIFKIKFHRELDLNKYKDPYIIFIDVSNGKEIEYNVSLSNINNLYFSFEIRGHDIEPGIYKIYVKGKNNSEDIKLSEISDFNIYFFDYEIQTLENSEEYLMVNGMILYNAEIKLKNNILIEQINKITITLINNTEILIDNYSLSYNGKIIFVDTSKINFEEIGTYILTLYDIQKEPKKIYFNITTRNIFSLDNNIFVINDYSLEINIIINLLIDNFKDMNNNTLNAINFRKRFYISENNELTQLNCPLNNVNTHKLNCYYNIKNINKGQKLFIFFSNFGNNFGNKKEIIILYYSIDNFCQRITPNSLFKNLTIQIFSFENSQNELSLKFELNEIEIESNNNNYIYIINYVPNQFSQDIKIKFKILNYEKEIFNDNIIYFINDLALTSISPELIQNNNNQILHLTFNKNFLFDEEISNIYLINLNKIKLIPVQSKLLSTNSISFQFDLFDNDFNFNSENEKIFNLYYINFCGNEINLNTEIKLDNSFPVFYIEQTIYINPKVNNEFPEIDIPIKMKNYNLNEVYLFYNKDSNSNNIRIQNYAHETNSYIFKSNQLGNYTLKYSFQRQSDSLYELSYNLFIIEDISYAFYNYNSLDSCYYYKQNYDFSISLLSFYNFNYDNLNVKIQNINNKNELYTFNKKENYLFTFSYNETLFSKDSIFNLIITENKNIIYQDYKNITFLDLITPLYIIDNELSFYFSLSKNIKECYFSFDYFLFRTIKNDAQITDQIIDVTCSQNICTQIYSADSFFNLGFQIMESNSIIITNQIFSSEPFYSKLEILFCDKYGNFITDNNNIRSYQICLNSEIFYLGLINLINIENKDNNEIIQYKRALSLENDFKKYKFIYDNKTNKIYINVLPKSNKRLYSIQKIINQNKEEKIIEDLQFDIPLFINQISERILNYSLNYTLSIEFNIYLINQFAINYIELYYTHFNGENITIFSFDKNLFLIKGNILYLFIKNNSLILSKSYFRFITKSKDIFDYDNENYIIIDNGEISLKENYLKIKKNSSPKWITISFHNNIYQGKFKSVIYEDETPLKYYFPSDNKSNILINPNENNLKFSEKGNKIIKIINFINSITYEFIIIIEDEPNIIINSSINWIPFINDSKPITEIKVNDVEIKKLFSNINGNFTLLSKENNIYYYIPKDNNEIVSLYYIDSSNNIYEYNSQKILFFSDIHFLLDFNLENCLSTYDKYIEMPIQIIDKYKHILSFNNFTFTINSNELYFDSVKNILNISLNESENNIFNIYLKENHKLLYTEKINMTQLEFKNITSNYISFYNSSTKTGKLIFEKAKCLLNTNRIKIKNNENSNIPISSCDFNSTSKQLICEYDTYHLIENNDNIFGKEYDILYNNDKINSFYLYKNIKEAKFDFFIPSYNYRGDNKIYISSNDYNLNFLTKINYTNDNSNISTKYFQVINNSNLEIIIPLNDFNLEYSIISFNDIFDEYIYFNKNDYIIKVSEPQFEIQETIFLIEETSLSKEINFTIKFKNSNDLTLFKNTIYLENNKCNQLNNNIFNCIIPGNVPGNTSLILQNQNNSLIKYTKNIPTGIYSIENNPNEKCYVFPFIEEFPQIKINVTTNVRLNQIQLFLSNNIIKSNPIENDDTFIYSFDLSSINKYSYGESYIKINNFPLLNTKFNFIKKLKSTIEEIELYTFMENQYIKLSFLENEKLSKIIINNNEYITNYPNEFIIPKVNFTSNTIEYINECNKKISIENLRLKISDSTPNNKISTLSNNKISNDEIGENRKIEVTFSNDIDLINDFTVLLIDRFNSSKNFSLNKDLISYKGESNRKNLKFYFKNNCTNETCGKYLIYTNNTLCPIIFSYYSKMKLKETIGTYYLNSNLKNVMIPFKEDVILSKSLITKVIFNNNTEVDYYFNYIELKDSNNNLIKYEVIQINYDFIFTLINQNYNIKIYDDTDENNIINYIINIQNPNFKIRVTEQFTTEEDITIMNLYDEQSNLISLYFDEEIDINYIDKVIYLDQELEYVETNYFIEYIFKFKNQLSNNRTFPSIQDKISIIMKNSFVLNSTNELIVINNLNRPQKVLNNPIYIMENSTYLIITFDQKIYEKYIEGMDENNNNYMTVTLNKTNQNESIKINRKNLTIDEYNNLKIKITPSEISNGDILIFKIFSDINDEKDYIKAEIHFFSCKNSFINIYYNLTSKIYIFSCQTCKEITPSLPYFSNYKCVSLCNYITYNNTCYSSCSNNNLINLNLKEYNKTCIQKCPSLMGITSFNNDKCILCSSLGNNYIEINGICSNNCPIETIFYKNECIFPEILNLNENVVSCENYCYNNGVCYYENSIPKCNCSKGFIGTLCEIYEDLIDIYFNNNIEIFIPTRNIFGERENESIFNLNNISLLGKIKLINVLIKYKNQLFIDNIMQSYIANYLLKSVNITKIFYSGRNTNLLYNLNTFNKMKSKAMFELIGLVFKIFMEKYEENKNKNIRYLQNENNINIENMNNSEIQNIKKSYVHLLKEIGYSLHKNEMENELYDINKCYVLYDSYDQLFILRMFNNKNSITSCSNFAIDKNIGFANITSCNNNNFNDSGYFSYMITYINYSFSNIDNLNYSYIMIDALEINNPYENNNNIFLYNCSNLNISLPIIENKRINYSLYKYYKNKGINIYQSSDKAFSDKCFRSDKFNIDLTQIYRKQNIYQNITFNGDNHNCIFYSLDNKMINLFCPYNETGMGYSIIENYLDNYDKTHFLIFQCFLKVKDLMNNIAFWLFLTMNIFFFIIIIFNKIIFNNDIIEEIKYMINDESNELKELNDLFKNFVSSQIKNNRSKDNENQSTTINYKSFNFNLNSIIPLKNNLDKSKEFNNEILKRSFCKKFIINLLRLHPLTGLWKIMYISPYYIIILGINILNVFGFNAIFFKETEFVKKRMSHKNKNKFYYPFIYESKKLFISIACSSLFCFIIKLISLMSFSSLKKYDEVYKKLINQQEKREKLNKKLNRKLFIKRIISIIFIILFDIFMFFYSVVFCYIYINSQLDWFYSGLICLLIIWIFLAPLFILFISIFNNRILIFYMKQLLFF